MRDDRPLPVILEMCRHERALLDFVAKQVLVRELLEQIVNAVCSWSFGFCRGTARARVGSTAACITVLSAATSRAAPCRSCRDHVSPGSAVRRR